MPFDFKSVCQGKHDCGAEKMPLQFLQSDGGGLKEVPCDNLLHSQENQEEKADTRKAKGNPADPIKRLGEGLDKAAKWRTRHTAHSFACCSESRTPVSPIRLGKFASIVTTGKAIEFFVSLLEFREEL